MKKQLFIITILFMTTSLCAAKKSVPMPEWIMTPSSVYETKTYMNGVGSGPDRDTAGLEAVKNLASVFGQNITSTSIASKKMEQSLLEGKTANNSFASLNQDIKNEIQIENLIGVEIAEYFYSEKEEKWYVIAILNKPATSIIYETLIKKNEEVVSELLKEVKNNGDSFYSYSNLSYAIELANENDKLMNNLQIIDTVKADEFSEKIVRADYLKVLQKELSNRIFIELEISGDESNKIVSSYQKVFTKYGFKTNVSDYCRYKIEGDFSYSISQKGKNSYCTYILDCCFIDNDTGGILFPINLKGREGDLSEQSSIDRAYRAVEKKIKDEFDKAFSGYINDSISKK